MTRAMIKQKVDSLLIQRIEAGKATSRAWLRDIILRMFPGIEGEDKDFYIVLAYDGLDEVIRECMRNHSPEKAARAGREELLPGFTHLQTSYSVQRGDECWFVPIQSMTFEELLDKAEEHRRQSEGHLDHAKELEAYAHERQKAEVASGSLIDAVALK